MKKLNEVYVAEIWLENELVRMNVFRSKIKAYDWAIRLAIGDDDIVVTKYKIKDD